jgi:hypothetical protein
VYYETGLKFVIDSDFSSNIEFMIKSLQDNLTANPNSVNIQEQLQDIAIKHAVSSMHQSCEWVMRAVQSSFVYKEHSKQNKILMCRFLLFNLRAR